MECQLISTSLKVELRVLRGNSSVGRARPCQGRGREFESRFPLQIWQNPGNAGVLFFRRNAPPSVPPAIRVSSIRSSKSPAWWQSGYAAACKAAYAGSIPTQASNSQSGPQALRARAGKTGRRAAGRKTGRRTEKRRGRKQ